MSDSKGSKIGCAVVLAAIGFLGYGVLTLFFRGPVVQISAAHVGRVKTTSGFQTDVRQPSIFRLPPNWWGLSPTKLINAELSDHRVEERIEALFMPTDKLNLQLQVVGTFRIADDEVSINAIYDRIKPVPVAGMELTEVIGFDQVYSAYGQQVVRTVPQEVVAQYTIQHVLENLDSVSKEIEHRVNDRLKAAKAPLSATYCGLGTVQPPAVIVTAQEKAKQRQIEIETAEAQKLVELTKADAAYQIGLKQQEIELVEAETQVLTDLILSDAVSEAYIAQRALRVLDKLAHNHNTTVLLSTKVFEDPASLLGLSRATLAAFRKDEHERQATLQKTLDKIEAAKKEALGKMKKEVEVQASPAAPSAGGAGQDPATPDNQSK